MYQLLEEAGIPPGVIQFVPGPPAEVVAQAISHPLFAGLHFTGSTAVFKKLWKDIAQNLDIYKGYPRIVGETGGYWPRSSYRMSSLLTTPSRWKKLPRCSLLGRRRERRSPDCSLSLRIPRCVGDGHNLASSHNILGQKCSALSRLYVSSSVWNAGGFKDKLLEQVAGIRVGSPTKFDNFMGPVM